MLKPGTWWIHSATDPRWHASGRALVGLFAKNREIDVKIAELTRYHGDPPTDLEWGYEKN